MSRLASTLLPAATTSLRWWTRAAPGASSGVFNLTVDETEGNINGSPGGGFISAFAGDTFPGNSSVNWDHPGQISASLVIAGLDDDGNVIEDADRYASGEVAEEAQLDDPAEGR